MSRVVLLLALAGCSPAKTSSPEGGDLAVPKMPSDAGPSNDLAASVKANAASHGWRAEEPMRQPEYVESEKLAAELRAAAKSGTLALAVVDDVIEECSSAGGTRILLKTDQGLVQFGEHGVMLHLGPKKDEVVVVAFEKLPAPVSIEKKAFCVPARTIYAQAKVVLGVAQRRDGERLVADLSK